MQFDNQKTRNVADVAARIMAGESVKTQPEMLEEELKGNQHKIDANKNNKIDAHDFKILRSQKEKEKANSMKYGKDVKEQVKPEVEKSFPATGVTKHAPIKGVNYMPKDKEKEKANSMKFGKDVKEETELTESHFKVGDEVICKASGMEGEVIKLDKEEGGDDEKYYTVKREDGKVMKYAPNELKKAEEEDEDEEEDEKEEMKEASKEQETKFHKQLDSLVHKTFGKRKEEMKEENIDEAMFPGTKEYEKKYGQSPQQKLKKVGDTEKTAQGEMKKTAKGVVHTRRFSEMLESYKETGLKYIAQMGVKEEATQDEYEKEIKKAQNKSEGKEKAEVAKAAVQAVEVQKEQTHTKVEVIDMTDPYNIEKKEIDLDEREMTDAEMKERERIVKGMKKGVAGFKQRYGDRAKSVMYATATKQAMKD